MTNNGIFCKVTDKGMHSFYLYHNGEIFFLFSQDYRKGVHQYFFKGVPFQEAVNFSKAYNDHSLEHTMVKIPLYIKYIEKEYDIAVYRKTVKKQHIANKKRCA